MIQFNDICGNCGDKIIFTNEDFINDEVCVECENCGYPNSFEAEYDDNDDIIDFHRYF